MPVAMILLLALGAGSGATEALRARAEEIRAALPAPGTEMTPQVRQRVQTLVTRTIDLQAMLQSALGARWNQMTEKQRKRLLAAFEARFRQTSSGELDPYRTTQIEYRPEVSGGEGVVQVPTRVVVKGEPTDLTYTMRQEKGGWRIIDIVVDGVSTVANYRSSFSRVIAKDGVEGLIKRLERGSSSKS